jgi:hypothetical protein
MHSNLSSALFTPPRQRRRERVVPQISLDEDHDNTVYFTTPSAHADIQDGGADNLNNLVLGSRSVGRRHSEWVLKNDE